MTGAGAVAAGVVGTPVANITIFAFFVIATLVIAVSAAGQNKTTIDYYAGGRAFTGPQNGIAIQARAAPGAIPSLITDPHINFAFFPLDNPGIVSIPLAFFLGWLGSVTDLHPADPVRFATMQVRALTGIGAERSGRG